MRPRADCYDGGQERHRKELGDCVEQHEGEDGYYEQWHSEPLIRAGPPLCAPEALGLLHQRLAFLDGGLCPLR
jgi:hypothetical protein